MRTSCGVLAGGLNLTHRPSRAGAESEATRVTHRWPGGRIDRRTAGRLAEFARWPHTTRGSLNGPADRSPGHEVLVGSPPSRRAGRIVAAVSEVRFAEPFRPAVTRRPLGLILRGAFTFLPYGDPSPRHDTRLAGSASRAAGRVPLDVRRRRKPRRLLPLAAWSTDVPGNPDGVGPEVISPVLVSSGTVAGLLSTAGSP